MVGLVYEMVDITLYQIPLISRLTKRFFVFFYFLQENRAVKQTNGISCFDCIVFAKIVILKQIT